MKNVMLASVAVGVLALGSTGFAQDEKMWLSTAGGKHTVMGGAKPADCPAGSFYTTDASQQMVMKCDDDAQFNLNAPESGAMMSDGKPYPEGSIIMNPAM